MRTIIRDRQTLTNSFTGDPNDKFTYSSPSTKFIVNRHGILESNNTLRTDHESKVDTSSTPFVGHKGTRAIVIDGTTTYAIGEDVVVSDSADITKYASGQVMWWNASSKLLVLNVRHSSVYFTSSSLVVAKPLGVRIENQRTNQVLRSSEFGTTWTPQRCGANSNSMTAPDGTMTADALVENGETGGRQFYQTLSKNLASVQYTLSLFVKPALRTWFLLRSSTGGETHSVMQYFNLTGDGAVGTGTTTGVGWTHNGAWIEPYANSWYRIALSYTTDAAYSTQTIGLKGAFSDSQQTYPGSDGQAAYYLWGAQVESGVGRPSTYIPTTSAQVTRSNDFVYMGGGNFPLSQERSTLFGAAVSQNGVTTTASQVIMLTDGTTEQRLGMQFNSTRTFAEPRIQAGSTYHPASFSITPGNLVSFAVAAQVGSGSASVNGAGVSTSTPAAMPAVNSLRLGYLSSTLWLNGHVRRTRYLPRRASDLELQAMTAAPSSAANVLLGDETDGLAFSFLSDKPSIAVRDSVNLEKNFVGDPNNLLTYTSPSTKYVMESDGFYRPGKRLRCDYDRLTRSPLGLLIEGQSTGFVRYSAAMASEISAWSSNASFAAINPRKSVIHGQIAHEHVSSGTGGRAQTIQGGLTENTDYRLTVVAERLAGNPIGFAFGLAPVWRGLALATWNTEAIAAGGGSISNAQFKNLGIGPNGGQLCLATCVVNSGSTGTYQMYVYPNGAGGSQTPTPGQSTAVHYAQIELASTAPGIGSPIVTSASQVTRTVDIVGLNVSRFPYSNVNGIWVVTFRGSPATSPMLTYGVSGFPHMGDNQSGTNARSALQSVAFVDSGGFATTAGDRIRMAFGYKQASYATSVNGAAVQTSTNNTALVEPTTIYFGSYNTGAFSLFSQIESVLYLPRDRVDNAEIQSLSA